MGDKRALTLMSVSPTELIVAAVFMIGAGIFGYFNAKDILADRHKEDIEIVKNIKKGVK